MTVDVSEMPQKIAKKSRDVLIILVKYFKFVWDRAFKKLDPEMVVRELRKIFN
jgi:hypothetical protein